MHVAEPAPTSGDPTDERRPQGPGLSRAQPPETQRPASLADSAPPVLGPPLLLRRPSAPWLSLPEHPASSRSARGGTASGLSLSLQLHAGLTLLRGRWFLSPAVQGVRVLPSTPHSKRMKVQGSGFEHS